MLIWGGLCCHLGHGDILTSEPELVSRAVCPGSRFLLWLGSVIMSMVHFTMVGRCHRNLVC